MLQHVFILNVILPGGMGLVTPIGGFVDEFGVPTDVDGAAGGYMTTYKEVVEIDITFNIRSED